ncbi:MAG: dicarboxylate/amino acid:cation symporter [Polyangiaceae bacterium]
MSKLLKFWRWPLHMQILLGLLVGAGIGLLLGRWGVARLPPGLAPSEAGSAAAKIVTGSPVYLGLELVGDLFIRGLKLIIVPLVMSSIILAIANLGGPGGFGRLGLKTMAYYMCTSLVAILIGLTLVDLVAPGLDASGKGILEGQDLSAFEDAQKTVTTKAGGRSAGEFFNVFRAMVPSNVVNAAAEAQLLGLIVVSILVGYFLAKLEDDKRTTIVRFTEGVYEITMKITDLVLRLAPIGVVGLLGATVAEQYARLVPDDRFEAFARGIGSFALVSLAALAIHIFGVMPIILSLVARVNPIRHFRAMAPALVTAFSTASSSATLPVTIDCVERRAGVSRRVASFTLPLGATVNMDGTALYECVAAIFICQAFGIHLTFTQQLIIVLTALMTSIGVAGVPAASLVAIIIILEGVQKQLPPGSPALISGLGLLFVFDRPLDMCRTAVNMFSDSVGAVTVARTEGETEVLRGEIPREGEAA